MVDFFPLTVEASGLVTPLGFNAAASLAAIRAGISAVEEANLWDPHSAENISATRVHLPQWSETSEKLADLVAPAVQECLQAARTARASEISLLIGVPTLDRPFRLDGLNEKFLGEIERRLGERFHPSSLVIPRGRISTAVGLVEAQRRLGDGHVTHCIVAGVDTFLRQEVVTNYIEERRLLTGDNSNGFIPGEAAAAVLIGSGVDNPKAELKIIGIGYGKEPGTIKSGKPLTGNGMTTAVREALHVAGVKSFDVDYCLNDLNGEHYKFLEAHIMTGRIARLYDDNGNRKEGFRGMLHPIENLGDIGVAIGPCLLALNLHAGQKGYAIGPVALCHLSNDDGERAAIITRFEGNVDG